MLVNSSGVSGDRLVQALAAIRGSKHRDRMVQFTTIDFRDPSGPGFGQPRRSSWKRTSRPAPWASARLNKNFGLTAKKTDGSRLKLDDPELDPIWQTAARLNVPVFIHTADPQEFFGEMNSAERALAGAGALPGSPLAVAADIRRSTS